MTAMKYTIIFLLLFITISASAQIRKEQSNYPESNALKIALQAKGFIDNVDVNMAFYSGGSGETHLLLADMSDGTYRTVVRSNGVNFDFVDRNDPLLVRMWTLREIQVKIASISGVSFSDWTKPASNYIYTITHDGVNYTGTDGNLPDSACKALTALVDALPAQALRRQ